jgi:hypothetical protein
MIISARVSSAKCLDDADFLVSGLHDSWRFARLFDWALCRIRMGVIRQLVRVSGALLLVALGGMAPFSVGDRTEKGGGLIRAAIQDPP